MEQLSLFSSKKNSTFPGSMIFNGYGVDIFRRPRRALSLKVSEEGKAVISCSLGTPLHDIIRFLKQHGAWLQKQLSSHSTHYKKHVFKKFVSGERFLYQGQWLKLKYQKSPTEAGFYTTPSYLVYRWHGVKDLNQMVLKQRCLFFYSQAGEKLLKAELKHWSCLMKLYPRSLYIGSQKSFWGACSSEGRISLNWRLVAAPLEVLQYVVIHELAHLKYLNHSPAFWNLVSRICPSYQQHKDWLRNKHEYLNFLLQ